MISFWFRGGLKSRRGGSGPGSEGGRAEEGGSSGGDSVLA